MRRDSYVARLGDVPMFQACSKHELITICQRAEHTTFEAGRTLIQQGERGREVFVLIDGKVSVTRDGFEVAQLGPGDYFGELAVLDPGPRDATVTATSDGESLVIDQRLFRGL